MRQVAQDYPLGLVVLSSLGLDDRLGTSCRCHAATSATLDIPPNEVAGVPEPVDVGPLRPLTGQKRQADKLPAAEWNPL